MDTFKLHSYLILIMTLSLETQRHIFFSRRREQTPNNTICSHITMKKYDCTFISPREIALILYSAES